MGDIRVDDICQNHLKPESVDAPSTGLADGDGFRSCELHGLTHQFSPTSMREDILLLSWLIVLLRTREGNQISYGWAYKSQTGDIVNNTLSMDEVVTGLQSNIGDTAAAISRHITTTAPNKTSSPVSILVSTGTLFPLSEDLNEALHLEIRLQNDKIEIRPVWHSNNMLQRSITRYMDAFLDTVKMCISSPDATIQDTLRLLTCDLDEIWGWNHILPPSYNFCMHEMITERAQKSPEKVAISSWDGELTYSQVDKYSTFVASSLKDLGVKFHDFLLLCFEKSRWTIVAVLAVMKAGATLVLMDPTLPLARLQNMAEQVGAKTMLISRKQHDLGTSIIPSGKLVVVEEQTFTDVLNFDIPRLPAVPSSALMYIIFTSGSTGTPKGVKISHETYTSSAIPRAKAVGYTEDSMVLDFASYAFDVSIDSMFLTLGNGGCLCIPSDDDRLNDINGAIRRMKVNYAGLTPSVARILDPDVISSLTGLGLGGEAASARDVTLWGQDTRIIIGYGPCECTIGCTVNSSAATGRDYISIGPGNGAAIWITNPDDHETLMPVGAVGEILVEGPIVGQGYFNDPDKTAAAFIHDPAWLMAGHGDNAGRRGRLYKTGDLGRYDPDGSGGIVFAGRKDTQVKLRGQRVELGEIESQLRARLPSDASVIAEVISTQASGGQPTLVAFISSQYMKEDGDICSIELSSDMHATLAEANVELEKVLPRYMVPTAYIPVNYIPALISGKTDRKRLRLFGSTVDLRQVGQGTKVNTTRQLNDLEKRLQQAWSQTLKLDAEAIRLDDNFFAIGGDSLAAMRLVSVCRIQGLDLSVTSTFNNPTLSSMAGVVQIYTKAEVEIPAFSTISRAVESACLEASQACGTDPTAIQDIYPCTPTQESLFTFSLKSDKAYIAQRLACIPLNIGLDAWKRAWGEVVAANPILCTRLAQLQEPGLQQVVVKEEISWRHSTDLKQYLEDDKNKKMELGERLARYAIIDNPDGRQYMVWTVHHVLYDGWSEPLILKMVNDALQNQHIDIPIQSQMRDFVEYVRDTYEIAMQDFWRLELKDAVGPQFPRMPSRDYLPTPDSLLDHNISLGTTTGSPFTMATLIRGAWALVASQYTGSDDVVFGETLTGRDIPMVGVEGIVGPLIATIPIRIRITQTNTVESYLQTVQQGILARTPYQHMGMQNIRKVSRDAQHACEASTGLVIQPEPEDVSSELGFENGDAVREALHFNPYPLMLACGIRKDGFRISASFDSGLIEVGLMRRILEQLETACLNLKNGLSRRVEEISCLPDTELDQIWKRNQTPPLSLDQSSSRLRADASIKPGSIYPQAVVPWVCDLRNPSLLSPIGCVGELWLEGSFFTGAAVESPAWLTAGSPGFVGRRGRVQATGDKVQLRDDGSLIFVGRKADVLPVQGHAVDVAELEAHFARYLPQESRAAAAMFQSSDGTPGQELVVFIEQQHSTEDGVEVLSGEHDITSDASNQNIETTISSRVSITLAVALKKLDRFIQDSLPSYMMPSAYIVVNKIPTTTGHIDHGLLNQLGSKIPQDVLTRLRSGFKEAWTESSTQTSFTSTENILRSSWAKILGISQEKIDVDDNFFRLGGDSVLAMKLVSSVRAQGHSLTVANIFQHMRLGDMARVFKVNQMPEENAQVYKSFSTLGRSDMGVFLSLIVRPQLKDSSWSIRDVSPVTDSQALDVRATVQAPRTSVQYNMLYLDQAIDRERLFRACKQLVKTHDILRTVFVEHESNIYQVVIDKLDILVTVQQTYGGLEKYVTDLCTADIESDLHLGSSFLKISHVQGNDGQCLIIRLSHAQYDGISLPRLLQDLEILYTGGQIVNPQPFSSYISQTHNECAQTKAQKYWRHLLTDSSLSVLPGTSIQPGDKATFQSKPIDISHRPDHITVANLLTAAWSLVLARRLRNPDVVFGNITSGRNIDLAGIDDLVGPCYQFTPVRVPFHPQWTGTDLLQYVQTQSAESSAHDFLGFERIAKCTTWSADTRFFDSVVHHQGFEDFDTMPFAGGECRLEILNPHGDAAYPVKAVSFIEGGRTSVGVVGSERDGVLVNEVLDELVMAVQELAVGEGMVLLDGETF